MVSLRQRIQKRRQRAYHAGQVAAVRLTFHYRFSRTIGSEVIARRIVTLYGDGTYEITGDWIQASALGMQAPAAQPEEVRFAPAPQPRARAMEGGGAAGNGSAAGKAGLAGAQLVLSTLRDNRGDVTWELDQLRSVKHPGNVAPASPAPFRNGATIKLDDWPVAGGVLDDISAWFQIDWQYNGQSLGNVQITNIGVNDSVGWGLDVRARIMDDDRPGPNGSASLRISFYYRFSRSIGSDVIAERNVILHGDGSYEISGDWVQASALETQAMASRRPALAAAY